MEPNFKLVFLTALIPLIVGFIWFNPNVFGNVWMRASGTPRPDNVSKGKMFLTFGLVYVFGLMLSMMLMGVVIHQMSVYSVLMNEPGLNDPNSELGKYVSDFMAKYGRNFRTFKHGVLHGTMTALFFGIPVMGTVSLFEQRSFSYFAVHMGYWIITLALMGGVICQFL